MNEFGTVDILVNNAAINPIYGPIESADENAFDKTIAVNVKAPWSLANLVLPFMKKVNKFLQETRILSGNNFQ